MSSIDFNPGNVNAEALQQILGQCQNGKLTMRISSEMMTKDVNVTGFSAQDIIDTANGMGAAISSTNTLAGSESISESKFTLDLIYEPYAGQLSSTASCVKGGNLEGATSQFSSAISNMVKDGIPVDVNALVQAVLRESYVDTTQDLQFYAEKVQYFNEAKKACREFVQDLRDMKTQVSDQLSEKKICYSDIGSENAKTASDIISQFFADKSADCSSKYAKDLGLNEVNLADIKTTDDLDNLISKFEEKLSTLGDDSQLANTDLQNVLQKQQQTIQMMSNISKMLSDTALAVIRKIG